MAESCYEEESYEEEEESNSLEYESEYSSSYYSDWIGDFLHTENLDWIAKVDNFFLGDDFNLNGLSDEVKNYKNLIKVLRGTEPEDMPYTIETDRELQKLYMLIHARYIYTESGLYQIYESYQEGAYGKCPRIACNGQKCIPYGMSTKYGVSPCLIYCPRCKDVYRSPNPEMNRWDGCAFGPYFAHVFERDLSHLLKIPKCEECKLSIKGFKLADSKRRLRRK
ncbi:Casein kinase II regulatory subunit family protein [Trichomonas vaginalis G3]|uniref:Casein kinase II subunit beta n=1 Tax=Trichomonas vaginalis (strain ATCC PRA-98 / G3) TaxID=412133 RepID=A2DFH2_TRIV3|nr:protein kinase regulator protein [Trichomonas vaginalis G3]EAY20900.1 Casein kinase II regulatory subunit family protein [Trichomonas vaginalis G3]KAI5521489.1 protein kinase regulator protein [Trichomonas vaginalis G3]|eukprot:XP_001581886.1 Casein kinase II regulatory subunit family protein [Trichomonas vaginalis G3]